MVANIEGFAGFRKGTGAAVKFFTQIFYARENFGATVLAKTVAPKFSKSREF